MRSILSSLVNTLSVCIFLFAFQQASAQYCVTNLYSVGCSYSDAINDITIGTISQTATGCGNSGYSDYTSLTSNFEQGSTYSLQVTTTGYGDVISMWIDFNDDYVFDASEKLISYLNCYAPYTQYTSDFIMPWSATLGNHRMRVRSVEYPYPFPFDACSNYYYGEVHDYTANITPPQDMSYISSTTTQTVTSNVSLGSNDVQIIGIQVVTSGSLNPISATSFTLNSNGSTDPTNDITNTKIYYTGTDPNFAATNLFGSATQPGVINGNQQLAQGVNYFWVAYDVSSSATIDDYIDAECTAVTVGGSNYTPTVTAPAGSRQLGYCVPNSLYGCYFAYIDGVELNTLSNVQSYCNGNVNGYINYAPLGNLTTSLELGTSYQIILTGSAYNYEGFGVWIDFNNDGDFSDADEFVYGSPTTAIGAQIGSISIPNNNGFLGDHRMRVRCNYYATVSSGQACTDFSYGETEDYTITLTPSTPMVFVSSTCTQNNTSAVLPATNNVEIIGIQVVTSGALTPFDLTSLDINSNGSDNFPNDVSNAKVYFTGSSPVFATTTLFGSSTTLPATISGNVTLGSGTNYFWVAYDVTGTATIGDQLDAECTSITMTGNGGVQVPTITAPAGSRVIDYCVPVNQYGCYYGYIDGVVMNSLSNTFTGCNGNVGSYIQYAPVGNYTTSVELGGVYSISLTGGPTYDYIGFGVWIDFNNDGDFTDVGEFAWNSPNTAQGTQIGSITIPVNATLGDHRMRIRSKDYGILYSNESCGETYYNGESEDYTITITPQTNMTYVSSTVTQTNNNTVTAGETDAEIIGIEIQTAGSLTPFNATSFTVLTNGTTDINDIANVKIYYTGTNPTFSTGTLFGTASPQASMTISGNQVLAGGTNYFWVAYDVSGTATLGNFLDAECTSITMSGVGGTQTPTVTAPAGNREINFCIGANLYGCYYSYINGVTINTLVNTNTYCNGNANGYIEYPQSGNTTTQLELGQSYSLQLDGPFYYYEGFGVWIDFNGNGNFNDPGEFVYSSPYLTAGTQYGSISLPCDASFVGDRRMRVRANYYTLVADSQSCSTFYNGETEDYTITLSPPTINQTYTSSTVTQNNTSTVSAGTLDAEIIGIQVSMAGCLNPLTVTSFSLAEASTTDFFGDVTNVKVYYTGTDPNFAPTNLFGSVSDLSFPVTGSQDLNSGTNYFWVAYDISANATLLNYVDASVTSIDITGQGTVTPSNSNPFGNRQINTCVPVIPNPCYYGDYINNVTFNTLSNLYSGCNGNQDNYISYAPTYNYTTTVEGGSTYAITLSSGYSALGFGVWIDFNNNSDFGDPGEFVYASPTYGYYYADSITIPIDPSFYGLRRMRVRGVDYALLGAQDYCNNGFYGGETEDYMITIQAPPDCSGTPVAGTVSANPVIICAAGNVDLNLNGFSAAAGLTFQWLSSPDGSTWSNIPGATNTSYSLTLSSSTYFEVTVTCTNSGLSSTTPSVLVQVGGNEAITSTTGGSVCGEGVVDITAAGTGTYVMWYDSPTSTSPLYYSSSPSTYSPYVNTTTTYYASSADGSINTGHVGPTSDSIGYPVSYYTYVGEYFNVLQPLTIQGVYVYPASAGDVILRLVDAYYNQVAQITYAVSASDINQKTFIPLNVSLNTGNQYFLYQYGGVNLYSDDYTYPAYPYPYTIPGVISIYQSSYGTNYYFCVYDWIINYSTLCESARTPVTVTVTAAPALTVTPDPANATICEGSGQSVLFTASGGTYNSFTWSPADGLSATTGATVSASPTQSMQYIVIASDGSCTKYDTVFVNVAQAPSITVSASPTEVCAGGASQLYASTPALGYSVYQIPFAPDQSGGGTSVSLGDDQVSSALPVGFNFNFYGNDYSEFYLSSNGFLSFDANATNGCCQGQLLPDPNISNNLIAFTWEDLYPPGGGTIDYYTTGTAPYRKCVIEYNGIPHFSGSLDQVTVQTIMYETTNWIEIHITSMPGNPNGYWAGHTEGIENSDGTLALTVPGRNAENTWTASNDAWRFAPLQYNYSWSPSNTLDNDTIANPMASPTTTTEYTVTVTNAETLCSSTGSVTVNLTTNPVAGTVTPDLSDFCGTGSTTLSLIDFTPGATIQWGESTTSGGPYNDIPGATDDSYTTAALNSTMYYTATATCGNSDTSTEATVQVDQAPIAPTAIDGFNCGPGHVVIGADGAGNGELDWFYSQNGNDFLGTGSPFTTPYINQTTTFYVEEAGGPAAQPLSTAYNGYYTSNGNMFDVAALKDVFITGFDVNMQSFYTSDFEIYYKTGTYVGSEYSPQNWTLLGVAQGVTGLGAGFATPLPISLNLYVPAGQTIGLYITCASYYSYVNTSYGTGIGAIAAEDANIQVKEGSQFYYPFSYGYGPYVWNGTVHYVQPGCPSPRTPVLAEITTPQVVATVSASTVCEGDPITLVITNYGQQTFTYEWSPQIPGMIPQNGFDDTVIVSPPVTMTFTVSVTDPNAPLCDTTIEVPITVDPTPVVFISNLATQYYTDDPGVTLIGIPSGGTFSGPGMTGSLFEPSTLAPGVYTIIYTYTDAAGCTGTYEQEVKILLSIGIGDVAIDKDINFFPNPSEGLFNMTMKLPSAAKSVIVTIYDQIGQQVFANDYGAVQQQLTSQFDFSLSPKGSYYVTINVDGSIFYRKITIQ